MAQHAKLMSPSSADRWLTCAGSPAMEEGIASPPSEYADEGTAAHFLGAFSLDHNIHPATFLGKTIVVGTSAAAEFDGAFFAGATDIPADFVERYRIEVDLEMAGRVNSYVQAVQLASAGKTLLVEQRLSLETVTGEKDAAGTSDAVVLGGGTLEIHDLKYGRGAVQAEGNQQLLIYLLAAIDEYSLLYDFTAYKVVIHQPKLSSKPIEWSPTQAEVDAFRVKVKERADVVMLAYKYRTNWIGKDDSYLTPSDDGCYWCKAKATCPKFYQANVEPVVSSFAGEFEDLTKDDIGDSTARWNEVELSRKMAMCDNLEEFIKAVRARVESEMLEGRSVPGYKLVAGKRGARQWTNEKVAEEALKGMRLKQDEMYQFKVISPTSAEKLFGEKGSDPSPRRWNKLQELIVQKDGKPHVAPVDDPRPALVIDKSAGFEDETGGDLC